MKRFSYWLMSTAFLFGISCNAAAVNLATDAGSKRTITLVQGALTGGSLEGAFNGADDWGAKYGLFSASSDGNVAPSAETPVVIDFVFGDDYKVGENLGVSRFVISAINNYYNGNNKTPNYYSAVPSQYTISGSTDGTVWTELVTADNLTAPTHLIIPYAKRGNYRRFRFTFTKNAGYTGTDHGTLFIQNIGIYADPIYYAKPDGAADADGLSWATATTVANALTKANTAHFQEIRLQVGTYEPGACLTATKMMTLVGGFAGTGATPDAVVGRSVLDAKGAYTRVFSNTTSPGKNYQYGYFTHLENLEFRNATEAGVNYATLHSSLTAIYCRFVGNRGNRAGANNSINGGRGLYFKGTSGKASQCILKDCEFIDNGLASGVGKAGMWDGSGAYILHGYATLESCLLASNGVAQTTLPNTDGLFGMKGHALHASAVVTAKNCRFVRNRGTAGWNGVWPGALGGATVNVTTSGNVFEGCLFLANEGISATTSDAATKRGAMGTLTVGGDTRIEGCTFAYNLVDGLTASAGVNVNAGTTSVTNSIFYGNVVGTKCTSGADLHVAASAYANLGHTMLSAASALTAGDATHVTTDATVTYDNPRFVTTADTMTACRTEDADTLIYYDPEQEAAVAAADVHLMTPAGYRKNGDATWYTESTFTSPAIDAGTGECANEPSPNGGVRNLGFYGNTAEASKSAAKLLFAVGAIPVQYYDGAPVCPVPSVTDRETGATIAPAEVPASFDLAYTGNTTYGTALVTLTGKAGTKYAGQSASKEFTISARFHVTNDVAEEGDGLSWTSPLSLTNAIALATRVTDEILMKAGAYAVTETVLVPRAMTIRGGYAGTDDATLADDPVSTLDGQGTLLEPILKVAVDTSSAERNVFERLAITRGKNRGLVKTGAASLELRSCRIAHNTDGVKEDDYYGIGANISGSAGATEVVLSNCVFASNVESLDGWFSCYGRGLSARSLKSLVLTDCSFVSNGIPLSAERKRYYAFAYNQRGWALYASSVPIHATNCVFRANRGLGHGAGSGATPYRWGGIVDLDGAGGGSTFDHCLFAGNQNLDPQAAEGVGDLHGAVTANFTNGGTCDFNFCTFLGNVSDTAGGSAALNLRAGAFTVRNSVFAHNIVGSYTTGGADIRLAGGTLTVGCSLFGGKGDKWILANAGASIDMENRGNLFRDALTVTSGETVQALVGNGSPSDPVATSPVWFGNSDANVAKVLAFDAHLLSAGGYRKNGDATWYEDVNIVSPGVNMADPDAAWGNEPAPNGSRANMGFYGNTDEASKTASGEVALPDEIEVTYPDGYSRPHISFVLEGTGAFSATVTVTVRTNANAVVCEQTFVGKALGDEIALTVPAYFRTGDPLIVSVSAEAYGKTAETSYPKTVTAPEPPWSGKKGPANVIHVRAGALGLKDGTSWSDAYDNFITALGAVTAEKNEIWVAGHLVCSESYAKPKLALPVTVRGGFTGVECTCAERAAGAVATLDGSHRASPLALDNAASVTVERVAFVAGSGLGIDKTGAGDLTLVDCSIDGNGWSLKKSDGYGANFTGSAGLTEVTLRNCRIAGNGIAPSASGHYVDSHDMGSGFGCYVKNLRRATFENCLFVTNGVPYAQPSAKTTGWRSMSASALYATAAPVTLKGCRFLCNRAFSTGGTIRLCAGTGGSALTNCLFVGNQDNVLYGGAAGSNGGTLRLEGDAGDSYDVVNCTFAANLIDCASAGGAVSVRSGRANVKNCIFNGNLVGRQCTTNGVSDLFVADGAEARLSYSLLSTTNTLLAAAGGTLTLGEGVKFGSANFVSNVEKFKNYTATVSVWVGGDVGRVNGSHYLLNAFDEFLTFNCHLRGPMGYADETTGKVVKSYATPVSPGLDAGDPADACALEPRGRGLGFGNGKRINMGFYGNTPWATRSMAPGFCIIIDGKAAPVDPPEPVKTYENILACDDATASVKIYDGNLDLTDPNALLWEWKWTDSPYTKSGYNGFAEAKSIDGGSKVALAGGGGWAIVEVATKNVLAYGECGGSPHSIILLPGDVVAVAVTHTWGTKDQLGVHFFDIAGTKALTPNAQNRTHFWMDNPHGFYWDADTQKLYVSDTEGLHRCSYSYDGERFSFAKEQTWAISDLGCIYGHDLTRVPNSSRLAMTTQEKVLFFDLETQDWAPSSTFVNAPDVKSYDISSTGEDILTATPKAGLNPNRNWVTNELDLYRDGALKLFRILPGAEFYKARWICTP